MSSTIWHSPLGLSLPLMILRITSKQGTWISQNIILILLKFISNDFIQECEGHILIWRWRKIKHWKLWFIMPACYATVWMGWQFYSWLFMTINIKSWCVHVSTRSFFLVLVGSQYYFHCLLSGWKLIRRKYSLMKQVWLFQWMLSLIEPC